MSDGSQKLTVDPPKLLKASEEIGVPQETIRKALKTFYDTIGSPSDAPWGTDEVGHTFFLVYSGQDDPSQRSGGYQLVLQALADLVDGLDNIGDKTKEMATTFIEAENANVEMT
jgi:hypothetical protein